MATYAIGDIQGCFDELIALLDRIDFDAANDQLWFTGDLVNRGPKSLAVLDYVHALGDAAIVVLGNHDLHLLACGLIDRYSPGKKDTFGDVLASPQRDRLLNWLRCRPLLHDDPALGYTMVHAGLPPQWTIADAASYAAEVEVVLSSDGHEAFFEHMYGNAPNIWDPALSGWQRLRLITNYLTRLRYTANDGHIDFEFKGPLGTQPPDLIPWYELYAVPDDAAIIFGHWSALQLSTAQMHSRRIFALDTGAVWGGKLTAMRLEDGKFFEVPSTVSLPVHD
jgi:bis(5'-nucleosyl)-tetraphosphatase (symmetrical)